ncbi:hypothetical protein BC827DRAFT_609764 [Russula dissimulans]|nr:hypothetical protein BC827DRAFT_609764 [Russula dissimulans]
MRDIASTLFWATMFLVDSLSLVTNPFMPSLPWSPLVPLHLTLLLVQLIAVPVEAQVQAADCLPAALEHWNWTYNSLNQAPCETAAYLAAECHDGQFTIPQLVAGNHYSGPSDSSVTDTCECNTVYYSLISACAGCQRGIWLSYDQWHAGCKTVEPDSTFPQVIINQTLVPAWAFLNVTSSDPWDNVTACDFGGLPESSGTARPPFAPKFSARSAIGVGVLVGLATGSTILALAAIGAGIWYFVRRHRRRGWQKVEDNFKSPSTDRFQATDKYTSVPWAPEADRRFYDPSDPTTYPDLFLLRDTTQSAATNPAPSAQDSTRALANPRPSATTYSGLPEV